MRIKLQIPTIYQQDLTSSWLPAYEMSFSRTDIAYWGWVTGLVRVRSNLWCVRETVARHDSIWASNSVNSGSRIYMLVVYMRQNMIIDHASPFLVPCARVMAVLSCFYSHGCLSKSQTTRSVRTGKAVCSLSLAHLSAWFRSPVLSSKTARFCRLEGSKGQ